MSSARISENTHVRNAVSGALAPDLAEHVLQLVDAAAAGTDATAQVVILRGAPGVGKTQILHRIRQACIPRTAPAGRPLRRNDVGDSRVRYVDLAAHEDARLVPGLLSVTSKALLLLDNATPERANALAGRRGGMVITMEATDGLSDEMLRRSLQFTLRPQLAAA